MPSVSFLKRLVPSLRKRVARLFATRGFVLRASGGMALLLDPDNFVDRQLAFHGDFEAAQQAYLLGWMRALGCDAFLDVGANIGLYSLRVAMGGLAGEVIAFEPDERNRQQLGANILLNRLTGRIAVRAEAVSAASGVVGFLPAGVTSTGKSRVAEAGAATQVACVALDEVVPGSGQRIFVKMDIEGHEIAACRGMAGCVARNQVFLQVECFAGSLAALTALLAGMGMGAVHRIDDDHYFTNIPAAQREAVTRPAPP